MTFWDRRDAGRRLAALAGRYSARAPVVVAIPNGGVPVALEVSRALGAPLETVVARKITAEGVPVGAVAEQGILIVDRTSEMSRREMERAAHREYAQMTRSLLLFHGSRGPPRIAGRTVIVVDDFVSSGNTARAAALVLRDLRPRCLVLAAPIVTEAASAALQSDYDELVCEIELADARLRPEAFYESFASISDGEALALIDPARAEACFTPA